MTEQTKKYIYIFSGLGADERVCKYLKFPGFTAVFINWCKPITGETIEAYAKRLLSQIDTSRPILIGLSFGGIIATEVAKLIDTKKVILIASAKCREEIPPYYRLAGFLQIHKFVPTNLLKRPGFITNWFFGAKTTADKTLLVQILQDTDTKFLRWALDKIVSWRNKIKLTNTLHIHGNADNILPCKFVKADFVITGGGHFMTMNKYQEINKILAAIL